MPMTSARLPLSTFVSMATLISGAGRSCMGLPRASEIAGSVGDILAHRSHGGRLRGPDRGGLGLSEKAANLAEQRGLLGVDLDPVRNAVEQAEHDPSILRCRQEIWQRRERLFRLEIDDVRLLADDLAGGFRRHVEETDILPDEFSRSLHGGKPPTSGAGRHEQQRRAHDRGCPVALIDARQRRRDRAGAARVGAFFRSINFRLGRHCS